jgi:uncharacterized protein YjbI with pentapeptide repeats
LLEPKKRPNLGISCAKHEESAMEADEKIELSRARWQVKAEDANMSCSSFIDVDLSRSSFKNVNIANAQIEDANLSGWRVRNVNFARLKIEKADLRGASIADSLTGGMTIDGIAVEELLAAYRALTVKAD